MKPKDLDLRSFIMVEEKVMGISRMAPKTWRPPFDVCENRSTITVRAEVPGIALEDLSVHIKGDTLVVRGTKRRPQLGEKPLSYIRLERAYGEFSQEIEINWALDAERAAAYLHDGVLTVELPKLDKVVEVPIRKK